MNNMEIMGFLAFSLDSIRCFTGPDMRFPTEMADVMCQKYSVQFTGGPKGPLGPTGTPTAYGTYLALKQAAKFQFGSESLDGKTIAVQGLGAVGWFMAEYFLNEDVKLIVSDINPENVARLIAKYPNRNIKVVDASEIIEIESDILCPCAIGGIIFDNNIPNLKCKIIFGPANNQLRATNRIEEERISKLLAQKGVLYQIDWWHNTGGVLAGAEEYENGYEANQKRLDNRIESIVPRKTWENLNEAKQKGITPTENAYILCEKQVYKV